MTGLSKSTVNMAEQIPLALGKKRQSQNVPQDTRAAASDKVGVLNRCDTVMTGGASWIIQKALRETGL